MVLVHIISQYYVKEDNPKRDDDKMAEVQCVFIPKDSFVKTKI